MGRIVELLEDASKQTWNIVLQLPRQKVAEDPYLFYYPLNSPKFLNHERSMGAR